MWDSRLQKAEKLKEAQKVGHLSSQRLVHLLRLLLCQAASAEANQVQEEMPLRDTILFGLGALTLSLLFAIHSGIIQVSQGSKCVCY